MFLLLCGIIYVSIIRLIVIYTKRGNKYMANNEVYRKGEYYVENRVISVYERQNLAFCIRSSSNPDFREYMDTLYECKERIKELLGNG